MNQLKFGELVNQKEKLCMLMIYHQHYFILKKKLQNNKKLLSLIIIGNSIGSGQEFTIKKFAKIISKILDNKNNLKFNKKYPDGTMRKILDNTIIKKLGWLPKINLNNGLTQTIKWYKSNYIKKIKYLKADYCNFFFLRDLIPIKQA